VVTLEKGDLFAGQYDAISHGANCVGVMGAGIANVFRAKFPLMHEQYVLECALGYSKPGGFMRFHEDGKTGYNLYSQDKPGADARKSAVFLSLVGASHDIMVHAPKSSNFRFALPLIGCGIGGLTFEDLHSAVNAVDLIFGEHIEYIVVYTDQNADQVAGFLPSEDLTPQT
jgi:O-acetyl-ADP-ribose deacetylase (regulator of RNase III)